MPKKQSSYDNSQESNSTNNHQRCKTSPVKRSNARVGSVTLRKRTKSENGILSGDLTDKKLCDEMYLEERLLIAEREAEKHVRMRKHLNQQQQQQQQQPIVTAIFNYVPAQDDELELHPGDKVRVLSHDYRDSGTEGWWVGLRDSQIGVFPQNFVESDSTWIEQPSCDKSRPSPSPAAAPRTPTIEIPTFFPQTQQYRGPSNQSEMDCTPDNECNRALSDESTGFISVSGSSAGIRTIPPEEIEKLDILGFGAFGMVYHGRWKQQDIALKTFSWHANELVIYQEAGHLSCLVHRNIVRLFGVSSITSGTKQGVTTKQLALIMEYARGGALHQLLHTSDNSNNSREPVHLSPRTLLGMSQQIADGMKYLHTQAHICHRDLKSSNVLVKEPIPQNATDEDISRFTLLITDFGMARRTAELVSQQSKLGTLAYAAPEVCKQQGGFTTKSDVWSYGVLLWELLTKEIPYRDVEQPHLLYRIAFKNHKLYIPEGIPSILVNLLKNCWAEDKDKRPDFTRIVQTLKKASHYKFIEIGAHEFHELQKTWRDEIRWSENHATENEDMNEVNDDADDDNFPSG